MAVQKTYLATAIEHFHEAEEILHPSMIHSPPLEKSDAVAHALVGILALMLAREGVT